MRNLLWLALLAGIGIIIASDPVAVEDIKRWLAQLSATAPTSARTGGAVAEGMVQSRTTDLSPGESRSDADDIRARILSSRDTLMDEGKRTQLLIATKFIVSTYKNAGVSGAIGKIEDCYVGANDGVAMTSCLYMDAAAENIVTGVEQREHFPHTEYFEKDVFQSRLRANLAKIGNTDRGEQTTIIKGITESAQDTLLGLHANDAYMHGDYATTLKIWRPLADQGNTIGEIGLAAMYMSGRGVKQDYREAARWYRTASLQGNLAAQIALAGQIVDGQGVLQDYVEALKWYDIAASQISRDDANGLTKTVQRERSSLAGRMTADQISRAQDAARLCLETKYMQCD